MKLAEITFAVLLEVVPVNHDGRSSLPLPAFLLFRLIVWAGILHDERQTFAIRRPVEIGNAAFDVRQFLSLSTGTVEQPHLRAQLLLRFISTGREECEVFVVGTPAWCAFAAVSSRRQPDLLSSVPTHHPEVRIALVLLSIDGAHGVGDPLSIRRYLRIANSSHPCQIIQRNWPLRGLSFQRERRQQTRN